ncbi:MAG: S-methyl-5'-thioadenosine phosphorylase [Candidatus Bathyarchaeota archaeon]|nr:S-methyl-5'-thioadenosine phosphorylase [Candidatus Bathyarchaeota archaeon]
MQAKIGIIGGTGLYDPDLLKNVKELTIDTPYGPTSDSIIIGELAGKQVAFLPRHGKKHTIRPTDVNSRANIFALKKLGVLQILAPSAVGSLKEEYKPGDIVFVDQFIDRTTKREQSFYTKEKVCHISVAEPMCVNLRKNLIAIANNLDFKFHEKGTYVCIEGPRFSTKAESKMFRDWNADVIGMTLVPECVLAREAELCYASISTITDYDVWKDHPVSAGEVAETMKANVEEVKQIILKAIKYLPEESGCECRKALKNAFL